jgi:hypothetical protein
MLTLTLMALLAPAMDPAVAAKVRYGTISCQTVAGGPQGSCQVALVPRGGGKISAYLTSPEGKQRIVYFRKGVPTFSDSGSHVSVDRNRDTMIIRVGAAEVYEMPDRLVAGE